MIPNLLERTKSMLGWVSVTSPFRSSSTSGRSSFPQIPGVDAEAVVSSPLAPLDLSSFGYSSPHTTPTSDRRALSPSASPYQNLPFTPPPATRKRRASSEPRDDSYVEDESLGVSSSGSNSDEGQCSLPSASPSSPATPLSPTTPSLFSSSRHVVQSNGRDYHPSPTSPMVPPASTSSTSSTSPSPSGDIGGHLSSLKLVVVQTVSVAGQPTPERRGINVESARLAPPTALSIPTTPPSVSTALSWSSPKAQMEDGGKLISIRNVLCRQGTDQNKPIEVHESLLDLSLLFGCKQGSPPSVVEHTDDDSQEQKSHKAMNRIDIVLGSAVTSSKHVANGYHLWQVATMLRDQSFITHPSQEYDLYKVRIETFALKGFVGGPKNGKLTIINKQLLIFCALSRQPGLLYYYFHRMPDHTHKVPWVLSAVSSWSLVKLYDRDLMDDLVTRLRDLNRYVGTSEVEKEMNKLAPRVKKRKKTATSSLERAAVGPSRRPPKKCTVKPPSPLKFCRVELEGRDQYGIYTTARLDRGPGGTVLGTASLKETKEVDSSTATVQGQSIDLSGQWIGFINHSHQRANVQLDECGQLTMVVDTIAPGEQLFWDYGQSYWVFQVTGCDIDEWKCDDEDADEVFTFMHENVDDYSLLLSAKLSTLGAKRQRLWKLKKLLRTHYKYDEASPSEEPQGSESSDNDHALMNESDQEEAELVVHKL
jgi:hypothetical protein